MKDKRYFWVVVLKQLAVLRRPTILGCLQAHCAPFMMKSRTKTLFGGVVLVVHHSGSGILRGHDFDDAKQV